MKNFQEMVNLYVKSKEIRMLELIKIIFMEYEWLNNLQIIGYTPAWNDGEPCYHCSYFLINGMDADGENPHDDEEGDWKTEEMSEKEAEKKIELYDKFNKEVGCIINEIEKDLRGMSDTNFKYVFRVENGNIVKEVKEYECGY